MLRTELRLGRLPIGTRELRMTADLREYFEEIGIDTGGHKDSTRQIAVDTCLEVSFLSMQFA